MKTTTVIAIIAIFITGAVVSLIPIDQVSAAPGEPRVANGKGGTHSDDNANNRGTSHAYGETPANQPCSTHCTRS